MFDLTSTAKAWAIAVAAAMLIALGVKAYHDIKESGRNEIRESIKKERDAERARTDKLKEESDHEWQTKMDALQSRINDMVVAPGPAIRVCKPATKVRVPDATAIANEAAIEPGPDLQAGGDIRRPLILYAGDCERTREQLTDLQSWVRRVTESAGK